MAFSTFFDLLYCQEEHFEEEEESTQQSALGQEELGVDDEEDDDWPESFSSLLTAESRTHRKLPAGVDAGGDAYLGPARRSSVEWLVKTSALHRFSAQTTLLAVNYLDRCFLAGSSGCGGGLRLQEDKPWMGRLAAVACLSLAAKVEETRLPLLLDLQSSAPEEKGYLFDGRTVRRMELLVLSTLGWRMNPITPLYLVRRLIPKLPATAGRRREIFSLSGIALLAVIHDGRWVQCPPSIWAAAALLHATGRLDLAGVASTSPEMQRSLNLLCLSEESIEGAYQLILELAGAAAFSGAGGHHIVHKWKQADGFHSSPSSPNGVTGSCFSCGTSSSAGDCPSPASSSPKPPPLKKPKHNNGESKNLEVNIDVVFFYGTSPTLLNNR